MKTQKIKLFAGQMIARWAQDSKSLAAMLTEIKSDKEAIEELGIAAAKLRLIIEGMGAGAGKVLHPNHVRLIASDITDSHEITLMQDKELTEAEQA
jgi:hypothetical protein